MHYIMRIIPCYQRVLEDSVLKVQLIYNAMLVSGIQQSYSVIYIYIYSFSYSFPIMVYHRILNIVPCAIQ